MKIYGISTNYFTKPLNKPLQEKHNTQTNKVSTPLISYMDCVNFTAKDTRKVDDIDYFSYQLMSPTRKQFLRKKYVDFDKEIKTMQSLVPENNTNKIKVAKKHYLPLMEDKVMDDYLKVCNIYKELKNEPILCVGRSPKWFLDTAMWMKDGIDDYRFVAFSKFWLRIQDHELVRMKSMEPTPQEKKAYKSYLRTMRATPKHIVEIAEKTGKKVVITDYITSGKGLASFLDLLSEYAEHDGILEKFANSIRLVTIGCMEFQENQDKYAEYIPVPSVPMPERLEKYSNNIKQIFHDMPLKVHQQMLINDDTNECRSSYYPHDAWTIYKPYNYKTGKISNEKLIELKKKCPRSLNNFSPLMKDYRNLLNFRILDYLETKGLLRDCLSSKYWR